MTLVNASVALKTDQEIIDAFDQDGFEVINQVTYNGRRGFEAQSKTVINIETKKKKRAYYVEGSSYEMGYLIGMMAHEDVEQMTGKFEDQIVPSLLHSKKWWARWAAKIIMNIVRRAAWKQRKIIPKSLYDEMQGIRDACRKINRRSKVGMKRLLALNTGFDIILATAYDPNSFLYQKLRITADEFQTALIGCNGFAAFGNATSDGKHYMGRDFMFPTAGVFQDVACMIVYNPIDTDTVLNQTRQRLPTLCMTAPGFAGCIAALNENGIGVGVDMLPGADNNINKPGVNSLLLVRHTADFAESADDAVNIMTEAERGVSWLYLIGDGKNNKAVVLEAGMNSDDFDPFKYPDQDLFKDGLLPSKEFFEQHENATPDKGLVARWSTYKYPQPFLDYNKGLFEKYGKTYSPVMMDTTGFINPGYKSGSYSQPGKANNNNPKAYYFAPQREDKDDLVLVTNMAVTPTMRLAGMHPDTVKIAGKDALSQAQWRYDALNKELLDNYGNISEDEAWNIINFLRPNNNGPYPKFYGHGRTTTKEIDEIVVHGSTSLLNLTDHTMKSIYGYFGDGPVKLSLKKYLD